MSELRVPKIHCARCDKEVDRAVFWRSEHNSEVEIVAYCHGDVDRSFITDSFICDIGPAGLRALLAQGGVAFKPLQALPSAEGQGA